MEVNREELGKMLGTSAAVAMKGRVEFVYVKRSRCHGCGGAYNDASYEERLVMPPPNPFVHFCTCPDGWTGIEEHFTIGVDAPPTDGASQ